ncbi:peptide/nickel transport system permease protein [Agromyces hippuratus]|uniref:Peptide/nickel transport system permease protein n=1 Tax=Agromyces hippuratus TaxID=286438 RepID=A0A852WYB0_9MICO|nr:ABC transporter permease [Agromyces hippuratus]NYG20084.1 peptide/nickel transport system permease protein [Agromyces hippuratus]
MTPGSPAEQRRSPRGATVRRAGLLVAGAVFVLWAVATLTFFAIRLIPGDPAQAILGGPGSQASQEALDQVRRDYGLDQPLIVQYFAMLGRLLTGDLGTSYALKLPVADLLAAQLGGTLLLAALSLVLAWVLALGLAIWSTGRGRIASAVGEGIEITTAALPHFWLAAVLIAVFSVALDWLPPVATGTPVGFVLPVVTLAIPLAGFLAQVMRDSLLDAMQQPFVVSARARGESALGLRVRHTIRHAALPAISLSGWALGWLLSGAVVVETIFAMPGLGRTLLQAVTLRDIPVVTGVVLLVALVYVLMTVLTDLAARIADPRLRQESSR